MIIATPFQITSDKNGLHIGVPILNPTDQRILEDIGMIGADSDAIERGEAPLVANFSIRNALRRAWREFAERS